MPSPDDCYHYLPVNDAAMQWGVYVTGIGRALAGPQVLTRKDGQRGPRVGGGG